MRLLTIGCQPFNRSSDKPDDGILSDIAVNSIAAANERSGVVKLDGVVAGHGSAALRDLGASWHFPDRSIIVKISAHAKKILQAEAIAILLSVEHLHSGCSSQILDHWSLGEVHEINLHFY